jgi:NADH-quinone oxidoreductase subunit N
MEYVNWQYVKWHSLSYILILALVAISFLIVEVLPLKKGRLTGLLGLLGALLSVVLLYGTRAAFYPKLILFGALYADPLAWGLSFLVLLALLGSLCVAISTSTREGIDSPNEFFSLYLFSTVGALLFMNAANLIVLFVGLEMMSLALYALVAAVPGSKNGAEAGLKYFLLGSFSSALMLYGMALLYGSTGSLSLAAIATSSQMEGTGASLALGLFLSGFLFKLGAMPLHVWLPDAYEGAPVSVTVLMATLVKVAAVGSMGRIIWTLAADSNMVWEGFIWIVALLTMVGGNMAALRQTSVKRMLAYSSIAHAGYLLVGIISNDVFPVVMFYLLGYILMTIGIFSGVAMLSKKGKDVSYDSFLGFGREHPWIGAGITLSLFSLAGLPPGLAGLFGKLYLLQEAARTGYFGLVLVALLSSVAGCYYYIKVGVALWSPVPLHSVTPVVSLREETCSLIALNVSIIGLMVIGFYPESVYPYLVSLFEVSS